MPFYNFDLEAREIRLSISCIDASIIGFPTPQYMKIWYDYLHNRLTHEYFSFETLQPTVCKLAVMHVINNNIPLTLKGPNCENIEDLEKT